MTAPAAVPAKRYPQADLIARQTAIRADELAKLVKVSLAIDALMAVHDTAKSPFSSAFDRAELALYDALASINGIEDAAHEQAEMLRDEMTPQPVADRYTDMQIDDAREARAAESYIPAGGV